MAGVKNVDIKEQYDLFSDVWQLYKNNYVPDRTEEYWRRVWEQAAIISEKYHKSELCHELILAVIADFERREGRQDNDKTGSG